MNVIRFKWEVWMTPRFSGAGREGGRIMVLELTGAEKEMLKRALESFEGELRNEIVRTDDHELKAILHDDESVIKKILEKVSLS
jgi:hypothetical protein